MVQWNNSWEKNKKRYISNSARLETKLDKEIGRETFYLQFHMSYGHQIWPQLTFTCSKSTIETLEKGVKYVQSSL